jgi:hypothetical protein
MKNVETIRSKASIQPVTSRDAIKSLGSSLLPHDTVHGRGLAGGAAETSNRSSGSAAEEEYGGETQESNADHPSDDGTGEFTRHDLW